MQILNSTNGFKKHIINSNIIRDLPTVNSNTVNSKELKELSKSPLERVKDIIEENKIHSDGIAMLIAELLDDSKSIKYYELLVNEHNSTKLLEVAYYVKDKDADRKGNPIKNKAVYFQGVLRNKGMKIKFRKD